MGNMLGHWDGLVVFGQNPQAQETKTEIEKWNYIKPKGFCTSMKTTKWRDNLQNGRKYF
jgi:hypothetical protein